MENRQKDKQKSIRDEKTKFTAVLKTFSVSLQLWRKFIIE